MYPPTCHQSFWLSTSFLTLFHSADLSWKCCVYWILQWQQATMGGGNIFPLFHHSPCACYGIILIFHVTVTRNNYRWSHRIACNVILILTPNFSQNTLSHLTHVFLKTLHWWLKYLISDTGCDRSSFSLLNSKPLHPLSFVHKSGK